MIDDVTETLQSNSDQLNAVDLLTGPQNVKILAVNIKKSDKQPITIKIDGDRQPFKPCLSMRRVLADLMGPSSQAWIGHSLTLYCAGEVTFGPNMVGGVRISHSTGITAPVKTQIRVSRSKVETWTTLPLMLELPAYPKEQLDKNSAAWKELFAAGTSTPEGLIKKMQAKFTLTDVQKEEIVNLANPEGTPEVIPGTGGELNGLTIRG